MPTASARKYPAAPTEWAWQYVFPASARCADDRDRGRVKRHHRHESVVHRAVKAAVVAGFDVKYAEPGGAEKVGRVRVSVEVLKYLPEQGKAVIRCHCLISDVD